MQNRVFFPQSALDQWLVDGTVDLRGDELAIVAEGRRYRLAEGVRILREVSGGADASDLVGRVKTKAALQELSAELLEGSMILGENAYDVVPGWLGTPIGSFDEHVKSGNRAQARKLSLVPSPPTEPSTDEDLLAHYLKTTL